MHYFFHLVRIDGSVSDLEGIDFDNDQEAALEACLVARELIGRELIAGRPVDWTSFFELVREDGIIAARVSFLEAAQVPQHD